MYRIHCHHFFMEVVVFTEFDTAGTNMIKTLLGQRQLTGVLWDGADSGLFVSFVSRDALWENCQRSLIWLPAVWMACFHFSGVRYSRDKDLHCCVYEFCVYVHSCVTVVFIHQYCFQSKMYGKCFLGIFLSHSDEVRWDISNNLTSVKWTSITFSVNTYMFGSNNKINDSK